MKHFEAIIAAVAVAAAAFAGTRELPLPQMPDTLTVPAERADYLALHFWDALDFADSAARDTALMSATMSNFISVLPHMSGDSSRRAAIDAVVSRAAIDADAAMLLSATAEQYLFGSESPVRNEAYYIDFLDAMNATAAYPDSARSQWLAMALRKNMPGTMAADFAYYQPDGSRCTLSALKGVPLLLLFYDPGCGHCREVIGEIAGNIFLETRLSSGMARVLAVRPECYGREPEEGDIVLPAAWLSGDDDGSIESDDLYLLPQYPCLYVLDRAGRVLVKDATARQALQALLAQ